MKKYFGLLIVLSFALIFGFRTAAAKITLNAEYNCEDSELVDGVKYTTCEIGATNDTEQAYSDTVTMQVKYYKQTSFSDFEIVSENAGLVSDINKEAGTFKFTFKGDVIPAGSFVLFKIKIAADPSLSGKDCGASISFADAGDNYGNTGSDPVPAANTGASIPVAIISFGAAACIAVYAGASRKTKMRRI